MIRRTPRSTLTDHSFPTRRSSDLECAPTGNQCRRTSTTVTLSEPPPSSAAATSPSTHSCALHSVCASTCEMPRSSTSSRSEEHTSELQSLMRISYAVFCLKKKINKTCIQPNAQASNILEYH